MGLLLILPLLVSGYLVCLQHPSYYYRLHRFEGQLLYLQVAKLGIICFLISSVLSAALFFISKQSIYVVGYNLNLNYSELLKPIMIDADLASEKNSTLRLLLIQAGLTSMLVPYLWAWFFIRRSKKKLQLDSTEKLKNFLILSTLNSSPLKSILRESIEHKISYMFTMADRKVYVGTVSFIGEPNESEGIDQEFNIVPILSGYRDKDTLEITFGTDYADAPDDLSIMLVQENVVSATKFNFETWEAFQKNKKSKAPNSNHYSYRTA